MIGERADARAELLPRLWLVRDMLIAVSTVAVGFIALIVIVAATADDDRVDPGVEAIATLGFEFALAIVVLLLALNRGVTFADLGFVRPRVWGPLIVAWLGAYVVLAGYGALILLLEALGAPTDALDNGNTFDTDQDRAAWMIAMLGIAVIVGAPFGEELLFRGLLFRGLRGYWRLVPAMAVSGLLFGVFHVNLSVLVPFSLVGLLFAWAFEESRSIWVTIAAHGGFNGVSFVVTMVFLE